MRFGHEQHPVHASSDARALGVQDLVVIAVKAPSLVDVARQVGPLIGPNTVVLTAMNGVPWWFFNGFGGNFAGTQLQAVDANREIAAALPAAHVVGCVVHASCSVTAPGVIRHHFGNGLIIGESSGQQNQRVLALAELLARAGFSATVSAQIQKDVWYKLGAFKTSMLQDMEAGKAVELDALVTVVKELGTLTGVNTPFTDALMGLSRFQARVRGLY